MNQTPDTIPVLTDIVEDDRDTAETTDHTRLFLDELEAHLTMRSTNRPTSWSTMPAARWRRCCSNRFPTGCVPNCPRKATRQGFADALIELGHESPNVVVLGGDVSGSVKVDQFAKTFPDRFFSVGVAEADMMGIAAGLALVGKVPFASAYGEFAAGRPFDQIRQSLAYSELPVKICASHCGITVGPDGATHQSLEDIALMRVV